MGANEISGPNMSDNESRSLDELLLTLSPALEVDEDEEQVLNSGACSDDRLHPDP